MDLTICGTAQKLCPFTNITKIHWLLKRGKFLRLAKLWYWGMEGTKGIQLVVPTTSRQAMQSPVSIIIKIPLNGHWLGSHWNNVSKQLQEFELWSGTSRRNNTLLYFGFCFDYGQNYTVQIIAHILVIVSVWLRFTWLCLRKNLGLILTIISKQRCRQGVKRKETLKHVL